MIIVELKKHFELRAIEWYGAFALMAWGFMVLLFPRMFEENPACHALLVLAPQHVWGLGAFLAGGLRLMALFVNGLWYRTPAVRWLTTMVSIFVWFCITAAFISSSIVNMGIVVYGCHVLADLYSAYRSATDFIEAEAQRKIRQMGSLSSPVRGSGDNVRSIAPRQR